VASIEPAPSIIPVDQVSPPIHRVILVVDVEGSTSRTNAAKAQLRRAMYGLLEEALWASGITEQARDPMIDRGDGILVLVHPVDQVPKTLLLDTFVPTLRGLLADHNGQQPPDQRFQLRTALHAGEVHYDARGAFGEALDVACRLLDAPQLKIKLGQSTAPLILVVSDDVYRSVIRHGYERIDDRAFEPLVHVEVGGYPHRGWVNLPARLAEQPWPLHRVTDEHDHLSGIG
jgi:class 3 adenylate cyclase